MKACIVNTDDGSRPLKPTAQENYCKARVDGKSQKCAFLLAYPHAKRWTDNAVSVKACRLEARRNVRLRIEWFQQQTASASIATREEVLSRHTLAARRRFGPLARFMEIQPDGQVTLRLSQEALGDPAIKRVRFGVKKGENGEDDVRILDIEFHDYLDSDRESAKLQGFYLPAKQDLTFHLSPTHFLEELDRREAAAKADRQALPER